MKRMQGFTLIEMMIAMIIAMIILAVVSGSYLNGLGTQRTQSELIRVQESARFAFDLISRSLRRSGYRNTYAAYPATYNYADFPREFCSTATSPGAQFFGLNDPASIDPTASNLSGSSITIANASDVLLVRGYGEDNPTGTAADGGVIDCLGNSIRRGELVEEILYIAQDTTNNNEPALFCRSSKAPTTPLPLVAGVESMQMLFGEDTDNDGVINRYVPFNSITNADNVFEVMVSIVVRSANSTKLLDVKHPFVFNQVGTIVTLPTATTTAATADNRVRREFTTTIAFRNYRQC
jgi:type IV pilus assembly protein PilW